MAQNALYLDYEYCSGCHSCELACRNERGLGLGEWGIKVLEDKPYEIGDDKWHWNYYAIPTENCDLCEKRVASGQEPACVTMCQAKCLFFGTIEECAQMLAKKGNKGLVMLP